jgi:hypothetical protein
MKWKPPALLPPEVEQLRAVANRPSTFPGDLISKHQTFRLYVMGLVGCDPSGDYYATDKGVNWLQRCGLVPYVDVGEDSP